MKKVLSAVLVTLMLLSSIVLAKIEEYDPNQSYEVGDIVSNNGDDYICVEHFKTNQCSFGEDYEPGEGPLWEDTWELYDSSEDEEDEDDEDEDDDDDIDTSAHPATPKIITQSKTVTKSSFTLVWEIANNGNPGETVKVYENSKLIDTTTADSGEFFEEGEIDFTGKNNGKYSYYLYLCNDNGTERCTKGNTVTITVKLNGLDDEDEDEDDNDINTSQSPDTPHITTSSKTVGSSSFTLDWELEDEDGNPGKILKIYENSKLVKTLTAASGEVFDDGEVNISGKKDGKYSYYLSLCNKSSTEKCTKGNTVTITVKKGSLNDDDDNDINTSQSPDTPHITTSSKTVGSSSFTLDWELEDEDGNPGKILKIYENSKLVKTLTAASGEVFDDGEINIISKKDGKYSYYLSLCNKSSTEKCTKGNTVTITVKKSLNDDEDEDEDENEDDNSSVDRDDVPVFKELPRNRTFTDYSVTLEKSIKQDIKEDKLDRDDVRLKIEIIDDWLDYLAKLNKSGDLTGKEKRSIFILQMTKEVLKKYD